MQNISQIKAARTLRALRLCVGAVLATILLLGLLAPKAFGDESNDTPPTVGSDNSLLVPEGGAADEQSDTTAPESDDSQQDAAQSDSPEVSDENEADTASDTESVSDAELSSQNPTTAAQLNPNNPFRSGTPTFVCGRDHTYLQHYNGQITVLNANGQETILYPQRNTGMSFIGQMNSLAIAAGGEYAVAVENYNFFSRSYRFWKFSLPGGWQPLPHGWVDTSATITGGAFSPADRAYYYSYYSKESNNEVVLTVRRLLLPDSVGGQAQLRHELVAKVRTNWNVAGSIGGDIAFDSAGNLFILASTSNSQNALFSVEREALDAARRSTNKEITATQITTAALNFKDAGGIAFRASGSVVLNSDSSVAMLDPFDFGMINPQPSYNNNLGFNGGARTDQASCDSPLTLTVEKRVVARKDNSGDQFRLKVNKVGTNVNKTQDTTGNSNGLQQAHVGPVPIVAGQNYRIEESLIGSGTLAQRYNTSYSCTVGNTEIKSGTGSVIEFTVADTNNLRQQQVKCTFTNRPSGSISWEKRSDNPAASLLLGSEWTVSGSTSNSQFTVKDCRANGQCGGTNDVDPRPGFIKIDNLPDATYTIVEKTAPPGHSKDVTPRSVTIDATNWNHSLGSITNKRFITTVRLVKNTVAADGVTLDTGELTGWALEAQLGGGSTHGITLKQGAAETGVTPQLTDGTGATPAELKLLFPRENATATLKISEINKQGWAPQNVTCVDDGTGQILASGTFSVTDATPGEKTVSLQGAIPVGKEVTCTVTNKRLAASVSWSKVNAQNPTDILAGSVWQLTPKTNSGVAKTVTDCVAASAVGCATLEDKDHRVGYFKVENLNPGDYALQETTAPEYFNAQPVPDFTISPAQLQHDLGALPNQRRRATVNARVQAYNTNGVQFQNVNMSGWQFAAVKAASVPQPVLLRVAGAAADANGVPQATSSLGELESPWEVHFPNSVQDVELGVISGKVPGWDVFEYRCAAPGANIAWQQVATPNNGPVQAVVQGLSDTGNVECAFKVRQEPGSLTWSKVDNVGNPLGESEWSLKLPNGSLQPITDCVAVGQCAGTRDTDPAPGIFRVTGLEWGQYELTETQAPAGFVRSDQIHQIAVSGANLHHTLGQLANQQRPSLQIPLTGGNAADFYFISGAVLALGSLSGPYLVLRRRRRALQ